MMKEIREMVKVVVNGYLKDIEKNPSKFKNENYTSICNDIANLVLGDRLEEIWFTKEYSEIENECCSVLKEKLKAL